MGQQPRSPWRSLHPLSKLHSASGNVFRGLTVSLSPPVSLPLCLALQGMWLMLQQEKPDDYVLATEASFTVEEFLIEAFGYVGLDWKEHVEIDPAVLPPSEVDNLRGSAKKARADAQVGAQGQLQEAGRHDDRRRPRPRQARETLVEAGFMDQSAQP